MAYEREARDQHIKLAERERKKNEEMPLLDFVRQVVQLMVVESSESFTKNTSQRQVMARHSLLNLQALRYDDGRHIVVKTELRGVCNLCKQRTLYRCSRHQVALQPDCFEKFHTADADM